MAPSRVILLDEPFEVLAPLVVTEVIQAVAAHALAADIGLQNRLLGAAQEDRTVA